MWSAAFNYLSVHARFEIMQFVSDMVQRRCSRSKLGIDRFGEGHVQFVVINVLLSWVFFVTYLSVRFYQYSCLPLHHFPLMFHQILQVFFPTGEACCLLFAPHTLELCPEILLRIVYYKNWATAGCEILIIPQLLQRGYINLHLLLAGWSVGVSVSPHLVLPTTGER